MNKVMVMFRQQWKKYLLYGLVLGATAGVLLYRLYKLVPYASETERLARESAQTYQQLIDNPLFLPHKIIQLIAYIAGFDGLLASRFISVCFAFIAIIFLYRTIRMWYTPRVAFLGTSLFVTSSWLLHTARMATTTVMYLLSIALLWAGLQIVDKQPRPKAFFVIVVICITLLFVPGFIWLLVPAFFWQRKKIMAEAKTLKPVLAVGLLCLGVVSFALLGYAFFRQPSLALTWVGLPEDFILRDFAVNLILTPYHIFVRAPYNPEVWLGRLPYINVAMTLLSGLGAYVLYKLFALKRIQAILAFILIGSVLAALGGAVSLIMLLPFICVAVTAGIALLLQQWFTVFPRNPIARTFGVVCVSCLVVLSAYYNMYQYFVAWPRNNDVRNTYTSTIVR